MSIGTVTVGTPAKTASTPNGSVSPAIPGASDAGTILMCVALTRGSSSMSETAAGAWTQIINQSKIAVFTAPGTETTAPTIQGTTSTNPLWAVVYRIQGAVEALDSAGSFTGNSDTDGTVAVVATIPVVYDGIAFVAAEQNGDASNAPATAAAISANSSVTWVEDIEAALTDGQDVTVALYHGLYTSSPHLAGETVTFTGGTTPYGGGQASMMWTIAATGATPIARLANNLARHMDFR